MNTNIIKRHTIRDILTLTHRNLLKMRHNPDNVSDVLIQPIIFTLLFGYLFGGSHAVASTPTYRCWFLVF